MTSGIFTLGADSQAFTLSGRPLEQGGKGLRRASGKAKGIGQKRTEAETEHDVLNSEVALHEGVPVIARAAEKRLVDMRHLMQEHLTDELRPYNPDIRGQPEPAAFFRRSANRENADFLASVSINRGSPADAGSLAQGQTDRNPGQPQAEGDMVIDALHFIAGGGPGRTEFRRSLENPIHDEKGLGRRAQLLQQSGVVDVGHEMAGKRTERGGGEG